MQATAIASVDTTGVRTWTIAERWPAIAVLVIGLGVLYAVGFSPLPLAHNAAHDTRHANGFPCH